MVNPQTTNQVYTMHKKHSQGRTWKDQLNNDRAYRCKGGRSSARRKRKLI